MPTSPLKRPSGRLGRFLPSLRPPARAGPLPVQTGFPTSLADLVVKNHVRLRNPKRRHVRPSAAAYAPPSPAPPAAAEPTPQRCEDVTVQENGAAAVRPNPTKGAAFSIRPEVLAVGGAVALALLVIWSKWLVAAATAASVALFWVESVRSSAARRPPEATAEAPVASCGRGLVSPIREAAESEAGTPRSSCADSDAGSEVSFSLWVSDTADGCDSIAQHTSKEKRRSSLRKLIARKLRNGGKRKSSMVNKDTTTGSLLQPEAGGEAVLVNNNTVPIVTRTEPSSPAPAVVDTAPLLPEDAVTVDRLVKAGGASPSAAALLLVPIILVGLVAGKLPAVALTVLCAVFFFGSALPSSAESAGRPARRA